MRNGWHARRRRRWRLRVAACWRPTRWSPPGRRILPKAETAADAQRCLTLLSGRRHRVMTAVVLLAPDGRRGERLVQSVVGFSRLSERQMATYLAGGEWRGKAGGYAIQGQRGGVRALPVRQLFERRRPAAVRDGTTAARARLAIAMSERILAACSPGEVRVAVVRDGGAAGLRHLAARCARMASAICYRGRVMARVPAMAGSFVALDGTEGFLPDSEGGAGLREGDSVPVRITRAAQGGKGPRLTARLAADEIPPARGAGPLLELAGRHPDAPVWLDDTALAGRLEPALGDRVSSVARAFDDDDGGAGRGAGAAGCAVPGAASACTSIPTPALVAIDVDAGERGGRAPGQGSLTHGGESGGAAGAGAADPAAQPVRRHHGRFRRPGRTPPVVARPWSARGAGGGPAAPTAARLHRAGPGRDRAAAGASAAARTAGRPACRRAGGIAPHRDRSGRAPAPDAGAARVAFGRAARSRPTPRPCWTLRTGPGAP